MEQVILNEGMNMPDFRLMGTDGNVHSPKDFAGKRLILYFYPKDNTAG